MTNPKTSSAESLEGTPDQPPEGGTGPSSALTPWEALPAWVRERYDQIGADEISDNGWAKLVSDSTLPIEVRGLSLIWRGAGPNHGLEIAYQAAPPPDWFGDDLYDGPDPDLAEMRRAGWDESDARQMGLIPSPASCRRPGGEDVEEDVKDEQDDEEYPMPRRSFGYDD